ncbi:MAG TPA: NAD(P)/FAD-dependent oxidoreductase [Aestuariivirgaceae bacterium]|nr:NAD(P)/FAD-dependent oxidoreductase [Aestuariivirgaceae bacterium]
MAGSEFEVVVVGGGAAGIAAARQLADANVKTVLVEARPRLGGRAWTVTDGSPYPIDLGCGWLHSAERNKWREIAEAQGCSIDRTPPPWTRPSLPLGFPLAEQRAFGEAAEQFYQRLESFPPDGPDMAAAALLEPGSRWNDLLNAVSTYVSGAELDCVSARDLASYDNTGVDWRIVEGYGRVIANHAGDVNVELGCPVELIDRRGQRLKVITAKGTLTANAAIITLPSNVLAEDIDLFAPRLPEKSEAAAGLPLGLADKIFLSLEEHEEFEPDSRIFGATRNSGTAAYHVRPFGRPQIEAYLGGKLARELEAGGPAAFHDFALSELVGIFGSSFGQRLKPVGMHCWGTDPFSRGSYSYALPGKAACRKLLAAPVDNRLFFAGEACSPFDFSTAHGAYATGLAAADQVIAFRQGARKVAKV